MSSSTKPYEGATACPSYVHVRIPLPSSNSQHRPKSREQCLPGPPTHEHVLTTQAGYDTSEESRKQCGVREVPTKKVLTPGTRLCTAYQAGKRLAAPHASRTISSACQGSSLWLILPLALSPLCPDQETVSDWDARFLLQARQGGNESRTKFYIYRSPPLQLTQNDAFCALSALLLLRKTTYSPGSTTYFIFLSHSPTSLTCNSIATSCVSPAGMNTLSKPLS